MCVCVCVRAHPGHVYKRVLCVSVRTMKPNAFVYKVHILCSCLHSSVRVCLLFSMASVMVVSEITT